MISLLATMTVMAAIASRGVHCGVDFQHSAYDVPLCLDQAVAFNCTVTGLALTWKIFYSNGTKLDSVVYASVSFNMSPKLIGGDRFTFHQVSQSPFVSNLSFTAQFSINGYVIVCEDTSEGLRENVTVKVDDHPRLVNVHSDTFTNSSVKISWTRSPSHCGVITYMYNVTKEFTTSTNSTVVGGLVPSDDPYCVTVTATEDYSTRTYNQECFLFNIPAPVENLKVAVEPEDHLVFVVWDPSLSKLEDSSNDVVRPDLHGYYVTLTSNTDDQFTVDSDLLPINKTSHVFIDVPCGGEYNITVVAINGVGNSLPRYDTIALSKTLSRITSSSTSPSISTISEPSSSKHGAALGNSDKRLTLGTMLGVVFLVILLVDGWC